MAEVNRWEDALKAWDEGVSIADIKRAGFLRYNTAVAHKFSETLIKPFQTLKMPTSNMATRTPKATCECWRVVGQTNKG